MSQFAVHPVEVADFASADPDVARRYIGLGTDVPPQLGHKGLAEAHNLTVALPFGAEVRPALGAPHGEGREGILENLFEAQELQDTQVHRSVEPQSALVGANGVVELYAVARIDLYAPAVIDPGHLERKDAVGFDQPLGNRERLELGMAVVNSLDGVQHFADSLQILSLARVTGR